MSTRATVHIFDDDKGRPLVSIYRHGGGSPEELGHELYRFLEGHSAESRIAGECLLDAKDASDLAAQIVTHLKGDCTSEGGVYLYYPLKMTDSNGSIIPEDRAVAKDNYPDIDFAYSIHYRNGGITIAVMGFNGDELFRGSASEMGEYWGFDPKDTIAGKIVEEADDLAKGDWIRANIPFRALERAVAAYHDSDAESFKDFIASPDNPSPKLERALNQKAARYDNDLARQMGVSFKKLVQAVDDYGAFVDPKKMPLARWLKDRAGLDADHMPGPKAAGPK